MSDALNASVPAGWEDRVAGKIVTVRPSSKSPKARLELHFYQSQVVRVLKLDTSTLRNRLGRTRRSVIDAVPLPGDQDYDQFLKDCERLLVTLTKEPTALPRPGGKAQGQPEKTDGAERGRTDAPAGLAVGEEERVVGRLLAFGEHQRGRKRTYTQFAIDVAVERLGGATHRIWGTDLERALDEAQVTVGDRIEVIGKGYVPITIQRRTTDDKGAVVTKPKATKKKVYVIRKLA